MNIRKKQLFLTLIMLCLGLTTIAQGNNKIEALVLIGLDYHDVEKQAVIFEKILNATGNYNITTQYINQDKDWTKVKIDFPNYDVIISPNLGLVRDWSDSLKSEFASYVRNGGNLAIIHQAVASQQNGFGSDNLQEWKEFQEIIGLTWNKSNDSYCLKKDSLTDKWIKKPAKEFSEAEHGKQHEFTVLVENTKHPITADMPSKWKHGSDELFHRLRGNASNMTILMSAFSDKETGGSGMQEPMAWTLNYGKGRVFVTVLGHLFNEKHAKDGFKNHYDNKTDAVYSLGFQTLFARGVQWAATGKVTIGIPENFPTEKQSSIESPERVKW